jgi:hypothetical protein
VNDFLVTYLDSIDEELPVQIVKGMRDYPVALLDGSITPVRLGQEWADWFTLAASFGAAHGWEGLDELEEHWGFLDEIDEAELVMLGPADRTFLEALVVQLDVYPAERDSTGG